jgi:hypothetical protein
VKWIGDKDKCAVGSDCSVYTAKVNGTLEVRGDRWKECPLDMGNGHCRRRGVREVGGPGCKDCTSNPVKARMDGQEQAISVAEELDKGMEGP